MCVYIIIVRLNYIKGLLSYLTATILGILDLKNVSYLGPKCKLFQGFDSD